MTITKYVTGSFVGDLIREVQVISETKTSVVLAGDNVLFSARRPKQSDHAVYHDSWADAHAYLIEKAEDSIENLTNRLSAAKKRLGLLQDMRQPG